MKAVELASMGVGYPAFFNDEPHIKFLTDMGVSPIEARAYAVGGCVVPQVPGAVGPGQPVTFHLAKCLELALHNGVDFFVTGRQLGPETGKFEDFNTYEDVVAAFEKQVEYFASEACKVMNLQAQPPGRDDMPCF